VEGSGTDRSGWPPRRRRESRLGFGLELESSVAVIAPSGASHQTNLHKPTAWWAAALTSLSGSASEANSRQPCARPQSSAAAMSARPTPRPRAPGTTTHPSRYATRSPDIPRRTGRIESSARPTGPPAPPRPIGRQAVPAPRQRGTVDRFTVLGFGAVRPEGVTQLEPSGRVAPRRESKQ